jgi:hypothetical protein
VLLDASVARSITVLGWLDHLAEALDEPAQIAHGVLAGPYEPCELRRIRDALQRQADASYPGSGRQSRAVAAVLELDKLLDLPATLTVLQPDADETQTAVRLTSSDPDDKKWRTSFGLRARRLDAGEAISIAIAHARGLEFASDDGQALVAYTGLTERTAARTLDIVRLLVKRGMVEESAAREGYRLLREDDLHLLGGPDW